MESDMRTRSGGDVLVEQLAEFGVDRVFSVPGESFLAVLNALYGSGIQNVVCRHEGAAAMMAEAHGKLTREPGVAFVTRGPGAFNAAHGVHVAMHDSTPMLLFIGQVKREHRDRDAFQEVDFVRMFSPTAKWAAEVSRTDRIPEYLSKAFRIACSSRPGPVVISLPEDMLHERSGAVTCRRSATPVQAVAKADAEAVAKALQDAERPMAVVGGSVWSKAAAADLARFAEKFMLPVVSSFRRQDYLDNRHPNYVGDLTPGMNPRLSEAVKSSDCLLIAGSRLGDIATAGYTLLDAPETGKTFIHVHPDPSESGRLWRADISLAAAPGALFARLAEIDPAPSSLGSGWLDRRIAEYKAWLKPRPLPGAVQLSEVVAWLSENLPEDAIMTNGAGNTAAFLHRFFQYKTHGTQVASTSGSMGYGLPAAISAKLEHPDRTVVCVSGDGCFQMTVNEFSTACQFGANIVAVVANNGSFATIRMHQELMFPDRVSGSDLHNPDFAALARSYGGHGEIVSATDEFPSAFERACESGVPSIIELRLDLAAITTESSIEELRGE